MSVFVDTSALYALLVSTEEGHTEVAGAFRELVEAGRALTTTNYVLVETVALLQHRFGLPAVRDLDSRILPLLRVVWIEEERHRRSVRRLLRLDRRQISLVDSSSFVVMEAEGIREALALDDDFRRQGYRLIPEGA